MTEQNPIRWNFTTQTDAQGRTYVISYYNKWNPEKKQSRVAGKVHVGRLNADTGEVTCSQKYLEAHPELIGKNLFFENRKLVERTEAEKEQIKKEADKNLDFRCDSVSLGLTYLCWEIARRHGIDGSLREIFGDGGEELLRLGIYELCSRGMAMQNYEDWLSMNYLPGAKPLSGRRISELLASVTQEKMDAYYKIRHDRLNAIHAQKAADAKAKGVELPPMMMAVDSTSIGTYSGTIEDAAYGHAKQDSFLKQANLTLCVDYETGDACYAYESEGSINDMALFPELIMRMKNCGFDLSDVLVVTDRGYSSVMNIQKQLDCRLNFLTGVRISDDATKALIDKYKDSLNSPVFLDGKLGVYARTAPAETWSSTADGYKIDYSVHLHLYRDGVLGELQSRDFMANVQKVLEAKEKGTKIDSDVFRSYSKYVVYDKNSKGWHLDADAVSKACKYNGYFAIRTNAVKNASDGLVVYRERAIVETCFRQFKVLNEGERLMATSTSYKGKIFVHLIAQTLRMMMMIAACKHKAEGKNRILPGDSLVKAMMQLQKLQATKPAGRGVWITKEIPKKTRDLFDLFGIQYPKKLIKN